jgi:hypothetical protein
MLAAIFFFGAMRSFLLLVLAIGLNCTTMDSSKRKPLSEVIAAHQQEWLKIDGVVGCGETETTDSANRTTPAVMIMVDTLTPRLEGTLPKSVDGYPVIVEQVGVVRPLKE